MKEKQINESEELKAKNTTLNDKELDKVASGMGCDFWEAGVDDSPREYGPMR